MARACSDSHIQIFHFSRHSSNSSSAPNTQTPAMKDHSLQHQHGDRFNLRESAETTQFNVKGMEKVLATVSGYHGAERFNLIKLISSTGASYVGNMNQAITHLVCLKFEGRKYELAKKFKIAIVNHCWIEECIKKGRRVSEEPYTFQSGEQVGPLCLDILLGINQAKAQSKALKNTKQPVIDIESDDLDNGAWMDSTLLDENLFPQLKQNSHCSNKSIRKAIKRNSKNFSSGSGYCLETPSGPQVMELEEASTSLPAYSRRLKKRNSTSPEPQCKGRKLVKKHIRMQDWLLTSNVEEGCRQGKMLPENSSSAVMSDISNVERHQPASSRHVHDVRFSLSGQDNNAHDDDIEEFQDVNGENQSACGHGAPSSLPATSEKLHEASHEDSIDVDHGNRHPASSELSCVICWTDFSSTRGVLPCGHRFCFSCIQSWADHMASRRKSSTCPLCKASFICITKVDDALSSDQKIYSQSIPHDSSNADLYILPDETYVPPSNPSASICCRCFSREPEDLLIRCHFCELRCVHSYCLDPPLFPWTCVHCKDLQILYLQSR